MSNKKRVRSDVQSPANQPKTKKVKLGLWKGELLRCGLEAVQSLFTAQESSYEKEVLCSLEKIGLAEPLTSIWRWQDPEVCEEFIRNWDNKAKGTSVFGGWIDVSLPKFLLATGLRADHLHCPTVAQATKFGRAWKYGMFCGAERETWCSDKKFSQGLLTSDLKNGMMGYLLVLLNKTLLLGPKNPFSVSRACVYLLVEAVEGNMKGFGTYVHERFISIMVSLTDPRVKKKQRLLAGPLMCFLYSHAWDKARMVSHISRADIGHSGPSSDRSQQVAELKSDVRDLTWKFDGYVNEIPDLVVSQHECKEEGDCKNSEISLVQQVEADFSTCYESLQSLYSQALKHVLDLTEKTKDQQKVIYQLTLREAEHIQNVMRLEKLYVDEQKHAKECFRLQFDSAATEGEVVKLRGKVEELTHQCRESSRRESFLELQLADIRRRWDMKFALGNEGMD